MSIISIPDPKFVMYRDCKIGKDEKKRWFIVLPSGFKTYPPGVHSEDDAMAVIDYLIK